MQLAEEILTQKSELNELQSAIDRLRNENQQHRTDNEIKYTQTLQEKENQIAKLTDELRNQEDLAQKRYNQLYEGKHEMEMAYLDKIKQLEREFEHELEKRKQEYEDKMEQDAFRF